MKKKILVSLLLFIVFSLTIVGIYYYQNSGKNSLSAIKKKEYWIDKKSGIRLPLQADMYTKKCKTGDQAYCYEPDMRKAILKGKGNCSPGIQTCVNSKWSPCYGGYNSPGLDPCNGI